VEGRQFNQLRRSAACGNGTGGALCALCEQVIEPAAPTILLTWVDRDDKHHRDPLHPVCHATWLIIAGERRRGRR